MSSDALLLYTYGLYLSNGGTPDGFADMTMDDVQLMYTASTIHEKAYRKEMIEGIGKYLSKMFRTE